MKRATYWPQAVLILAFNCGALLGWSAVAVSVNWDIALPLYAGGLAELWCTTVSMPTTGTCIASNQ
ncbi:uncharacterized protein FOMMEDRAFT_158054 [Fomitiporia mediterranea MF3/22]|uniref:uncharacterized protein n=1 Tax=Fomitiporia mediterranea (strain MF3/22) TaxID=694068 RepID=UPI0004408DCC|nr:uncharacterized protein FOMMEDRAFT_158054 [Fomitiporia mediterranea MF3/22]EJD00938.1 hypothetical protein FOMMEDRAFT_158054 [Fomitiporia mediterranea MF3/22]